MCPLFGDLAICEYHDSIRDSDRRKAMGNQKRDFPFRQLRKVRAHFGFRRRIQGSSGFI